MKNIEANKKLLKNVYKGFMRNLFNNMSGANLHWWFAGQIQGYVWALEDSNEITREQALAILDIMYEANKAYDSMNIYERESKKMFPELIQKYTEHSVTVIDKVFGE